MSSTTTQAPASLVETRRKVTEAAEYIRSRFPATPRVGVVLGSGLGALADAVEGATRLPYAELPHFPTATAPGHSGNLVLGQLESQTVVMMQGRFHTYEGYSQTEVTFPIRVMKALGVDTLIVTCATGGLNFKFKAGDLMVIVDHLNLTGSNPLIGPNDPEVGERFPVMFDAYSPELRAIAHEAASEIGIRLQEGVYAGITGPAYFTKAELRYLIKIGADSLGMSTVPEVIVATHAGIKVLGIGTISDMAIPDAGHHATEKEILAVAAEVGPRLQRLVKGVLARL